MIKLQPTLDRVAILPDERIAVTEGKIIIPDKAQKKTHYGTVLAIGPGGFNIDGSRREMSVKEGDRVLYTGSHDLTQTGSKVIIADEEDIIAVAREVKKPRKTRSGRKKKI